MTLVLPLLLYYCSDEYHNNYRFSTTTTTVLLHVLSHSSQYYHHQLSPPPPLPLLLSPHPLSPKNWLLVIICVETSHQSVRGGIHCMEKAAEKQQTDYSSYCVCMWYYETIQQLLPQERKEMDYNGLRHVHNRIRWRKSCTIKLERLVQILLKILLKPICRMWSDL
jgi:hypothetical protein